MAKAAASRFFGGGQNDDSSSSDDDDDEVEVVFVRESSAVLSSKDAIDAVLVVTNPTDSRSIDNDETTAVRGKIGDKIETYNIKEQDYIEHEEDVIIVIEEKDPSDHVGDEEEIIAKEEKAKHIEEEPAKKQDINKDLEKENHVDEQVPKQKVNMFAQFAFGTSSSSPSNNKAAPPPPPPRGRNWVVKQQEPKTKKPKTKKSDWKPMTELSTEERERVRIKWHGLILDSSSCSLEDSRFQVMVASRLHARCQEPMVRKCMASLQDAGVLTCTKMAECDPEVLANLLTCLQYYNVKSKHLVQASKELLEQFNGQVPESKNDLLTLTGIGPVMADLLSNVNTRAAYQAQQQSD